MNELEVADLIEKIEPNLTPNEFLVALANAAVQWERQRAAKEAALDKMVAEQERLGLYKDQA